MKTSIFLFVLSVFLATSSAKAQEMKINIDKVKVSFYFVKEKANGSLSGFEAYINFNPNDLSKSVISGSVKVSTINTGVEMRDKHLKSSDYFDAAKYPNITFKSKSFEKTEKGYKMTGIVKIKDVEKEVVFYFTYENKTFTATATIYANDFGVTKEKKREDSKVKIKITVPVL